MKLLLVSANRHKLLEFERLLAGKVSVVSLVDVGLAGFPIAETGESFEANARIKIECVRSHVDPALPIIADDSGLEVVALNRTPGIYSARYSKFSGHRPREGNKGENSRAGERGKPALAQGDASPYNGEPASDDANNRKLLAALRAVPAEHRQARYVCALAYQFCATRPVGCVMESCEGEILDAPRGAGGFGYDPLFYLPELGKSMAELSPDLKDKWSHRGKACRALLRVLAQHLDDGR